MLSQRFSLSFARGVILAQALVLIAAQSMPGPAGAAERRPKVPEAMRYLGEKPPGRVPVLFAPGVVSTDDAVEFAPAFSPDGSELYFSRFSPAGRTCAIMVMRYEDGGWTAPEKAPFTGCYMTAEPFVSSCGEMIYFSSKRPAGGEGASCQGDIWFVRRSAEGWSKPSRLPWPVNTGVREGRPSLTASGDIFFHRGGSDADIYFARRNGGGFDDPERLGCAINTSKHVEVEPLVAPDGRFLIFYSCGRRERVAARDTAGDLYVSFRAGPDEWTAARVMDRGISSTGEENWPALSPDGKYLFFTSSRAGTPGIYWVDASVIEDFRGPECGR